MSKNIVDVIIDYCITEDVMIGIIPSRRQVENNGGYVNNWTTEDFCQYVKRQTSNAVLVRDHAGPAQGYTDDDGIESFKEDCKYFDFIHVDVWKKHQDYDAGLQATIEFINLGLEINPEIMYEVGTEEAIRPFTTKELDRFLTDLKARLSDEAWEQVIYAVIQSGTALNGNTNVGTYNVLRLIEMCEVVKKHGLISKEHNGDYLPNDLLVNKFNNGLETINVAPEFGQIETEIIYQQMDVEIREKFYQICYDSKRWGKWVSDDFKPEENKEEVVNICGHYVFSHPEFLELKSSLIEDIDLHIKLGIKRRILDMLKYTQWVKQLS